MKAIDECETVQELLCDESRWCTGHASRFKDGTPAPPFKGDKFCLSGAAQMIDKRMGGVVLEAIFAKLRNAAFKMGIGHDYSEGKATCVMDVSISTTNDLSDFPTIQKLIKEANV